MPLCCLSQPIRAENTWASANHGSDFLPSRSALVVSVNWRNSVSRWLLFIWELLRHQHTLGRDIQPQEARRRNVTIYSSSDLIIISLIEYVLQDLTLSCRPCVTAVLHTILIVVTRVCYRRALCVACGPHTFLTKNSVFGQIQPIKLRTWILSVQAGSCWHSLISPAPMVTGWPPGPHDVCGAWGA